jgi:hypothetical protein
MFHNEHVTCAQLPAGRVQLSSPCSHTQACPFHLPCSPCDPPYCPVSPLPSWFLPAHSPYGCPIYHSKTQISGSVNPRPETVQASRATPKPFLPGSLPTPQAHFLAAPATQLLDFLQTCRSSFVSVLLYFPVHRILFSFAHPHHVHLPHSPGFSLNTSPQVISWQAQGSVATRSPKQ